VPWLENIDGGCFTEQEPDRAAPSRFKKSQFALSNTDPACILLALTKRRELLRGILVCLSLCAAGSRRPGTRPLSRQATTTPRMGSYVLKSGAAKLRSFTSFSCQNGMGWRFGRIPQYQRSAATRKPVSGSSRLQENRGILECRSDTYITRRRASFLNQSLAPAMQRPLGASSSGTARR